MKKFKILTIDDEPDFVAIIKNYFSLRGYDVFTAVRGVTGLEIVQKEKPDVVFIDLKLPGIDGAQILTEIKKIHPEAKTIMLTAYRDDGETRQKFMDAGVYAFFEKPVNSFKELEEAVKKAVKEKK